MFPHNRKLTVVEGKKLCAHLTQNVKGSLNDAPYMPHAQLPHEALGAWSQEEHKPTASELRILMLLGHVCSPHHCLPVC